ncbi:hypothetical protein A0O32_0877 [Anoxybacillus flavithermus]|nr:hypothetical protein A0O32_0877 [Anoxybacillus flavithermus]
MPTCLEKRASRIDVYMLFHYFNMRMHDFFTQSQKEKMPVRLIERASV